MFSKGSFFRVLKSLDCLVKTNFRFTQIEIISKRQNKSDSKFKILIGETMWEKGENDGYYHFLLFPQQLQFSIGFLFRVVRSRDCVEKEFILYRRTNQWP